MGVAVTGGAPGELADVALTGWLVNRPVVALGIGEETEPSHG